MCTFIVTRPFHGYQNFLPSDLDLEVWPTFKKTLTLAIAPLPEELGLSYFICTFLVTRPFHGYQSVWPSDLDLLKNFNLGNSFLTRRVRAFIFHMCIPFSKTFSALPWLLTKWPWPWRLTYFIKKMTWTMTFESEYCCYLHMVAAGELCSFLTTLVISSPWVVLLLFSICPGSVRPSISINWTVIELGNEGCRVLKIDQHYVFFIFR